MVECLTRYQGVAVLSLRGGTVLVLYPLLSTGSTQAFKEIDRDVKNQIKYTNTVSCFKTSKLILVFIKFCKFHALLS